MADQDSKRLTVWTATGIGVVVLTLALAGLGLVWAIRQTQSLTRLRIADLQTEARLVKAKLRNEAMTQLEASLLGVAGNLRRSLRADPVRNVRLPSWIDEICLFDAESTVLVWHRTADGDWRRADRGADDAKASRVLAAAVMGRLFPPFLTARFDPRPEPVQFVYDASADELVVIAHHADPDGRNGLTIFGLRLNLTTLRDKLIVPELPPDRLACALVLPKNKEAHRRKVAWTEDLAPIAPYLVLSPTESFIARQHRVVLRQTMLFVAGTALAMGALLAVIWAMWRVFRREIALSQMKQAFVADVSHELKTPLALIRLFGETLLSGRVPTEEKKREYYEIITRESDRLTHLINNILDFARIDAGKKRYRMQSTDVAELVRETYEAYQLQLEHEGFEHQLVIGDNLPRIRCDRDAVAQALINLINNAMKYTDADDKFLGIDLSREIRRGQHGVLISVSDRGIGVTPEDRNRLFSGFYRADDKRVREQRGAGLGLALVKHIADGHGGIVDVESRLVKGSTFRVFFPVKPDTLPAEDEDNGENSDR